MNAEKSKVTSIFYRRISSFLVLSGKNENGIFIRAHRKSLAKAKKTLKLLQGETAGAMSAE